MDRDASAVPMTAKAERIKRELQQFKGNGLHGPNGQADRDRRKGAA